MIAKVTKIGHLYYLIDLIIRLFINYYLYFLSLSFTQVVHCFQIRHGLNYILPATRFYPYQQKSNSLLEKRYRF